MSKLILYPGSAGDFDGKYKWVDPKSDEKYPEYYTVGKHDPTGWPEDYYVIVRVKE